MTYDTSCMQNIDNPWDIIGCALSLETAIPIFLISGVFLMVYKMWTRRGMETSKALVFSFFITEIFAALFWMMGWISGYIATLPLVLLFAGFIISAFTSD